MKFDYCIGNPPYQVQNSGDNDFTPSVFNDFMDAAYEISDKVELITPAKFLFNAGNTPKNWNEKMLKDVHFKVLKYEPDSSSVFPRPVEIKGGVAIHYRDATKDFGAIEIFTSSPELQTIIHKLNVSSISRSLASVIYVQNKYELDLLLKEHPECRKEISGDGKDKRLRNNAFDRVSLFSETSFKNALKIIGVINNKRVYRYIDRKYIDMTHENISKYKVLLPAANGSGAFEVFSTPFVGEPYLGYTQTFIGIGAYEDYTEADHCLKYIKTKMCRAALGILKVTQTNSKDTWRYVPIQDFTDNSDIDWSQSISDIDKQLYKKYGLSKVEIDFIETHVKEME